MPRSLKGKLNISIDVNLRCALCGTEDGYLFEGPNDFLIPPVDLVATTWGAVEEMIEAEIEDEGWAKTDEGWSCPRCSGKGAKAEEQGEKR